MAKTDTPKPTAILATADSEILGRFARDLATINQFAKAVSRTRRTVERWVCEKRLPIVRIGDRPYIYLPRVRQDILDQLDDQPPDKHRAEPADVGVAA